MSWKNQGRLPDSHHNGNNVRWFEVLGVAVGIVGLWWWSLFECVPKSLRLKLMVGAGWNAISQQKSHIKEIFDEPSSQGLKQNSSITQKNQLKRFKFAAIRLVKVLLERNK